jgi:hypothetical protein
MNATPCTVGVPTYDVPSYDGTGGLVRRYAVTDRHVHLDDSDAGA